MVTYKRITPTCVGNTVFASTLVPTGKDHPHLRGEYAYNLLGRYGLVGSPPLAWGIPPTIAKAVDKVRITPTCVGNTLPHTDKVGACKDHPHLRGEYSNGSL